MRTSVVWQVMGYASLLVDLRTGMSIELVRLLVAGPD